MISIMKYFDQARSGIPIEELLDINRRLVRAIGEHAVKADPPGYDRFRAEIARIETELGEASSLSALQGASNSAVKVMEDYNRSAGESMHARAQEMQQMVSMLTGAVEKLANGCERSVANLRAIEKQIEQASAVEDIRVLRGKLTQCVGELRLEAARQREESGRVMADVKKELKRSASASDGQLGPNGLDRVTGLPGKSAAQQAFEAAIASEGEFCVAAFVFPRIRLIKSRFGAAVGDKIVSSFASHLRGSLFIEGSASAGIRSPSSPSSKGRKPRRECSPKSGGSR